MDILEIMNVPYYKKGNTIHIKKENRGKFTKSAKERGMGVLEFATHVLNNKDKYSPTLVKRANFAKNSKKFKHAKGGLIKKCQNGEILDNQPISYKTWKDYEKLKNTKQNILEGLAMLQYTDNKATYGDDVPEEAKYLYDMGLLPEVEVSADRDLNKKESYLADLEWRNYLSTHPIQIGSEEYNRLPEKAKAQVYKNSVTDAIDKAALPTATAIIAPTALTAGAASLVSSGALTAAADAAGTIGTKIAGTNLGQATSAFFNNPYVDLGFTTLGALLIPLYLRNINSDILQGNYLGTLDDASLAVMELLGGIGMVKNFKNVTLPFKTLNGEHVQLPQISIIDKLSQLPKLLKRGFSNFVDFYTGNTRKPLFYKVFNNLDNNLFKLYLSKQTNERDLYNLKQEYSKAFRAPLIQLKGNFIREILEKYPDLQYEALGNILDPSSWWYDVKYSSKLLNPVEINHTKIYEDNVNKVSLILGNVPFKITGSSILNGKGITYSQTGADDVDFLMNKKDALELAKKYGLELNNNGTAFRNSVIEGVKVNPQFIDETEDGFAIGRIGVLFFLLKYPKEYLEFVKYCQKNDLDISKTPLPIKAEDLFNNITEEDVIIRGLMDNMISTSPKNMNKHLNRTLHSMFSTDLDNVQYYQKAQKLLMESMFGNFNSVEKLFPNIKFDNKEDNLEFLKDLLEVPDDNRKIIPYLEKIASDSERMKVIANSLLLTYSTSARHTQGIDNVFNSKVVNRNLGLGVNIINPKGDTGGGHRGGPGTNSSLGKAPEGYGMYESIFNYPITHTPERFTLVLDLTKQIKHLQNRDLAEDFITYADGNMSINTLHKLDLINLHSKELDYPVFLDPNNWGFLGYSGLLSDPYHVSTVRIAAPSSMNAEGFYELPHEMLNIGRAFHTGRVSYLSPSPVLYSNFTEKENFVLLLKDKEKYFINKKELELKKYEEEMEKILLEINEIEKSISDRNARRDRVIELEHKYNENIKRRNNILIDIENIRNGSILTGLVGGTGFGIYKGLDWLNSEYNEKYPPMSDEELLLKRDIINQILSITNESDRQGRKYRKYSIQELLDILKELNNNNQYKNGGFLFYKLSLSDKVKKEIN